MVLGEKVDPEMVFPLRRGATSFPTSRAVLPWVARVCSVRELAHVLAHVNTLMCKKLEKLTLADSSSRVRALRCGVL